MDDADIAILETRTTDPEVLKLIAHIKRLQADIDVFLRLLEEACETCRTK